MNNEDQIRKISQEVYTANVGASQFNVGPVQFHTHNGIDSPRLNTTANVGKQFTQVLSYTAATSGTQTINCGFAPTRAIFFGTGDDSFLPIHWMSNGSADPVNFPAGANSIYAFYEGTGTRYNVTNSSYLAWNGPASTAVLFITSWTSTGIVLAYTVGANNTMGGILTLMN